MHNHIIIPVADLFTASNAVRTSVVGGRRQGAAVVVPEFDDDEIAGYELGRDGGEATLVVEGARGAPADGGVDYGDAREGVGEVDAPA
jgi:hypothetical protein